MRAPFLDEEKKQSAAATASADPSNTGVVVDQKGSVCIFHAEREGDVSKSLLKVHRDRERTFVTERKKDFAFDPEERRRKSG